MAEETPEVEANKRQRDLASRIIAELRALPPRRELPEQALERKLAVLVPIIIAFENEVLSGLDEKEAWRLVKLWRDKYNALLGGRKPRKPEEIEQDLREVAGVVAQITGPISLDALRTTMRQLCREYLAAESGEGQSDD